MRINKFIAHASGLSRRAADTAIQNGRVKVNGSLATTGDTIESTDSITLDGAHITLPAKTTTIVLNKPAGYVCSRLGQGSRTVYDLLPTALHHVKPVGRLDKDSSGLLLLTDDGKLANQLTHPRYAKNKIYEIELNKPLLAADKHLILKHLVQLNDGLSGFKLEENDKAGIYWRIVMQEGRNRQIRRTFAALGYSVTKLHRTQIGTYELGKLAKGSYTSTVKAIPR